MRRNDQNANNRFAHFNSAHKTQNTHTSFDTKKTRTKEEIEKNWILPRHLHLNLWLFWLRNCINNNHASQIVVLFFLSVVLSSFATCLQAKMYALTRSIVLFISKGEPKKLVIYFCLSYKNRARLPAGAVTFHHVLAFFLFTYISLRLFLLLCV